ncbi:hypothetical protein BDV98DRAFT_636079, partial [Pterulicium gracile]
TPPPERNPVNFTLFADCSSFEVADFLYCKVYDPIPGFMTTTCAALQTLVQVLQLPPFMSKSKLYDAISAIANGTAPWQLFTIKYTGPRPAKGRISDWMDAMYKVWYCDSLELLKSMLQNPAFKGHFDTVPYKEVDKVGKRCFKNLFSGDWVWQKASKILRHYSELAGSILVSTVAGSDKTTVSVMTGNNEYYPMYLSAGNLDNKTH